ncbi:Hypothetical predicted protein, partial [Paramuricea clavata]
EVDNLEKGGLAREWCVDVKGKLRDAKRYLKTGYRVHCKPEESTCPDHCPTLSDENDSDYQEKCSHQHSEIFKDCCNLVDVLHDIECKIQRSVWNPYSDEQREDLQYDFKQARSHISQWKAHILRSANQEAAKQDHLKIITNKSNVALVVMDWAMKFQQLREAIWYFSKESFKLLFIISMVLAGHGLRKQRPPSPIFNKTHFRAEIRVIRTCVNVEYSEQYLRLNLNHFKTRIFGGWLRSSGLRSRPRSTLYQLSYTSVLKNLSQLFSDAMLARKECCRLDQCSAYWDSAYAGGE